MKYASKQPWWVWICIGLICGLILGTTNARGNTLKPKARIVGLAPPIPCTRANRMDIFVDEDNILWACECEALVRDIVCHWQQIGGVEAVETRRWLRKHNARIIGRTKGSYLISINGHLVIR